VGFPSGATVLPTGSNWGETTGTAASPDLPDRTPEDAAEWAAVEDGEDAAFVELSVRNVKPSFRVHDLP